MIEWLMANWFILALIILPIVVWVYRNMCSYRTLLAAELEKNGYEYISEEVPGAFNTGPFPKFEIKLVRSRTVIAGISGNWTTYRIVYCRDSNDEMRRVWVRIRHKHFQLSEIDWSPVLFAKQKKKQNAKSQ